MVEEETLEQPVEKVQVQVAHQPVEAEETVAQVVPGQMEQEEAQDTIIHIKQTVVVVIMVQILVQADM